MEDLKLTEQDVKERFHNMGCYHENYTAYTPKPHDQIAVDGCNLVIVCGACMKRIGVIAER